MANRSLLLATYFIFPVLFLSYSPSLCCPQHQKEALLQFKSLFLSHYAKNSSAVLLYSLESWNSGSDCCHWDRVTCHSRSSSLQVTGLSLDSLHPQPQLETDVTSNVLTPLFRLRTLMWLDNSWNLIQGEIPGNGFANLTKLVHLDMSSKIFNSSIPPQLFHLRYLQHLDLSSNLIEGILSRDLGGLRNLRLLNLNWNSISGNIPVEIGNLTELQLLLLGRNKLYGGIPSSISNLRELEVLDLSTNSLAMEIPTDIGNLLSLSTLFLDNNHLTGAIPPSILLDSNTEVEKEAMG